MCQVHAFRRNFINLMSLLSILSFCYYNMSLFVKYIPGNLLGKVSLSSISDIVSSLLGGLIYHKLGPRRGFATCCAISLVSCILLITFWKNEYLLLVFVFLSRFGVSASYVMVFVAFVQLIPSLYNSSVFGISNLVARIITILAPMVAEQPHPTPIVTSMFFLTTGIICAQLLVEKLPNTV